MAENRPKKGAYPAGTAPGGEGRVALERLVEVLLRRVNGGVVGEHDADLGKIGINVSVAQDERVARGRVCQRKRRCGKPKLHDREPDARDLESKFGHKSRISGSISSWQMQPPS